MYEGAFPPQLGGIESSRGGRREGEGKREDRKGREEGREIGKGREEG